MKSFFELHPKSKIGYKVLSPAELHRTGGHTTHIGLFGDTVAFVTEAHRTLPARLIYQNKCLELPCFFDFITRSNGDVEAPKIRMGNDADLNVNGSLTSSIVREIVDIVSKKGNEQTWYLIWFGLSNEEFVFYLIEKDSVEYNQLILLMPSLSYTKRGKVNPFLPESKKILEYLEVKAENSNIDYLQDLEIFVQTGEIPLKIIKPRYFDIAKANKQFSETGRKGEELIAEYLSKLQSKKIIKNFTWVNKSKESSYPYDFEFNDGLDRNVFMDVKTTAYTFNQKMVFSNSEIAFINQNSNYYVYRVYGLNNTNPSLRVCEDFSKLSHNLDQNIANFKRAISENETNLNSLKLQISPANRLINFNDEIILS